MLRIHTFGALAVRDGDRPLAGAAAQPRRLAVLAVLARAGERGVTRDKLLALLWPDSPDEAGRRALAQALYALRRDLGGEEPFLGVKDLRLNPEVIGSDVGDFESALAAADPERAAAVYAGPFLDGFRVPGLDDFDRWIETERAALALRHAEALESLAGARERAGDHTAAVAWWRRLAGADPLSARVAVRLMRALDAAGDRAGALQHARIYESLVDAHLGLPPSPEVTALAERLRSEPEPVRAAASPAIAAAASSTDEGDDDAAAPDVSRSSTTAVAEPPSSPVDAVPALAIASVPADEPAPRWPRISRSRWAIAGAAAVVGVLLAGWRLTRGAEEAGEPVLAIGRIGSYTGGPVATPISDLLATDLARGGGVRVVSRARLFQELRGATDTTGAALASAARSAGATQLVEGDVYSLAGGRLRLDLRRVDLRSGAVIAAYRLEGSDAVALADSGAGRLARDLPSGNFVGGVTTSSPIAYRLYERGLESYTQGDPATAARMFDAALAEDSAFAMAAYHIALVRGGPGIKERALRLAETASDRERLIIRAGIANITSSPTLLALAETLSVRYPREAAGPFYVGVALLADARWLDAVPWFRRVVEMDGEGLRGEGAGCMACNALRQIVSAYESADSIPAANRVAREWTRLQPRSAPAWNALYETMELAGAGDEAMAVYGKASTYNPALTPNAILVMAQHRILRREYDAADRLLAEQMKAGDEERVVDSWWYLAISRREQGRMRDALHAARQARLAFRSAPRSHGAVPSVALLEAQILFETGRFRESAALLDSIAWNREPGDAPSRVARAETWTLTHKANALAALDDTAHLRALADTVRERGMRSYLARDHRLHHHVLGLLHRARGDWPRAAAELRQAIVSPNAGYTRTNVALAGVLMRMNRPREAVAVLQPALRGSLEASNLYVNRTEVHALLARAWQAAGSADSAAAHQAVVARARVRADPDLIDTSGW
ncbi:MAG TPA: BTAD domain-containing putative transcriptional regulator [Longimicrobium sp.]